MRTIVKAYLSVSELFKGARRDISTDGNVCSIARENTMLLRKLPLDAMRINIPEFNDRKKHAMNREDYEYYAARPLWIKIRLCLFWLFWTVLVAVIVLFVFIYWCILPSLCSSAIEYSI